MFNYNHLYYFFVTAKAGTVTEAARRLRISQPSLSAQLRTFQNAIDRELFRKVGRTLSLTLDGEMVYGFCTQMFDAAQEMGDTLAAHPASGRWRIRMGVTSETSGLFLADLVSHLLRDEPGKRRLQVTTISAPHATLLQRLTDGELDVILSTYAATDEHVHEISVFGLPVLLMVSKKALRQLRWPKGRRIESLSIEKALKALPTGWVMPNWGSKLRSETQIFLEKKGLSTRCAFESDSFAAVVRSAADGAGIALLPREYVTREIDAGELIPLGPKRGFWVHRIWILSRRTDKGEPVIDRVAKSFNGALIEMRQRVYL